MCSLFGSTDKEEFFKLAKLNSYRGTHSHSVAAVGLYYQSLNMVAKGKGPLTRIELPENEYGYLYIGHQQAPTTEANDDNNIHPSESYGSLWHNGIIKAHQVKQWQQDLAMDEAWDTALLQAIIESNLGYESLSGADGSFACIHHLLGKVKMFRNDNCPLFVKGASFSSTEFDGSESIDSNVVYEFDNIKKNWNKTSITFETKNKFYWSPE